MHIQFGFVIFWRKDFGTKAAHKILVKLTPGRIFFKNDQDLNETGDVGKAEVVQRQVQRPRTDGLRGCSKTFQSENIFRKKTYFILQFFSYFLSFLGNLFVILSLSK